MCIDGSSAAESESRPDLESGVVDCFAWSQSRSWSLLNFSDSDAGYQPTTDNDFGRTVMYRERHEEKESGSLEIN